MRASEEAYVRQKVMSRAIAGAQDVQEGRAEHRGEARPSRLSRRQLLACAGGCLHSLLPLCT